MANGCLNQRVSREEFMRKSADDKLVCLFDVVSALQADVEKSKRHPIVDKAWAGLGGMVGGALAALGIKVVG